MFPDAVVEAPISLYFGFPPDAKAELETVAAASIAWAQAMRVLVAEVEPGLRMRIELVDAEDGSLWLKTLLKFAEDQLERIARGAEAYPRLKALAKGLAIIVVATPLSWTATQVWEQVVADEPELGQLSPEGEARVRKIFEDVLRNELAAEEREVFARVVARDPDLASVSVASEPMPEPRFTVKAEQIRQYVDRERLIVESKRARVVTKDVILVSPVLEERERSWKFREPGMPEFGAVMRDQEFLAAIGRGLLHEEMRAGIQMTVEMEIREQDDGGVWIPLDRSVLRVIRPYVDRSELPFPPSG